MFIAGSVLFDYLVVVMACAYAVMRLAGSVLRRVRLSPFKRTYVVWVCQDLRGCRKLVGILCAMRPLYSGHHWDPVGCPV